MTKEELLKVYLSDNIVKEKNYLKNEDVNKIKWSDKDSSPLVTIIKLAIEGELSQESNGVTIRKINQLLNS